MVDEEYDSMTIRREAPECNVFTVINHEEGKIIRINAHAGKAGTIKRGLADGISQALSAAFRAGADPEEVAVSLRGIGHTESSGVAYEASSIPDAIGQSLMEFLEAGDRG